MFINEETDFSPSSLCAYLNAKFGGKFVKSKEGETTPFNPQDIQGFQRRGCLPKKYGGDKVETILVKGLNISMIRLQKDIENDQKTK